ncbi:olfactory receptor 493-like [Panthera leo]|uniref:olfactory receptor 493-like n=1 Tax=Panthera leo TaxID=9689 RepID=UPI001C69D6F7|nr:olfactory receptor 493-like [Panthera leo]
MSTVTYVILLGFGDLEENETILFFLFLSLYMITLFSNLLLIFAVQKSSHLHTPMYFFLCHLSCVDVGYLSSIFPQLLWEVLAAGVTIYFTACVMQLYVVGALPTVECFLLAVMSYDCSLAICRPLRYSVLTDHRVCVKLAVASWTGGFLFVGAVLVLLTSLTFCGPHIINHFFCDFFPLVKLSCTDTTMVERAAFASSLLSLSPFFWTLLPYGCILSSILRISSSTGRHRAFSTCSSHLIVMSLFYGTLVVVYMIPPSETTFSLNKIFSLFYTVLIPILNPLVYSLGNKDVQIALEKEATPSCSIDN